MAKDKDQLRYYTLFAPMHAEDGTRLLTCADCGGVVQERAREIHDAWHLAIVPRRATRMEQL